ncbi:hypothetical protein BDR26DRAFT_857210 [Obelidium mucronatum]|nr:hypothetical protein BDR26DRAFT_857210 [Obelidium mucronatum]
MSESPATATAMTTTSPSVQTTTMAATTTTITSEGGIQPTQDPVATTGGNPDDNGNNNNNGNGNNSVVATATTTSIRTTSSRVVTTTSAVAVSPTPESGSGSGLGIGIGVAVVIIALAIAAFFFFKKRNAKKETQVQERAVSSTELVAKSPRTPDGGDSSSVSIVSGTPVPQRVATQASRVSTVVSQDTITQTTAAPAAQESIVVVETAPASAAISAASAAVVVESLPRSILFVYDTDYSPSGQVCEEMELALAAKLEAQHQTISVTRFGIEGLPEEIELPNLSSFEKVVVVLRKAERFRIYREGKIFTRLEELCGDKLTTVVFEVIMQNGNMDAQRHDGFPLVYFSTADKKIVDSPGNDATLNELTALLL